MTGNPGATIGNVDVQTLAGIFGRHEGILAVYLFGSRTTGHPRPNSDLDLAIVPRAGSDPDKLALLADLARHGFDDVDLIVLDKDDIVLIYEAVRPNCLLYAREEFDHGSYFSLAVRRYLDFLPYLDVQRRAYQRRILDGTG